MVSPIILHPFQLLHPIRCDCVFYSPAFLPSLSEFSVVKFVDFFLILMLCEVDPRKGHYFSASTPAPTEPEETPIQMLNVAMRQAIRNVDLMNLVAGDAVGEQFAVISGC